MPEEAFNFTDDFKGDFFDFEVVLLLDFEVDVLDFLDGMTDEDTSQIHICKKASHSLEDLTRIVNNSRITFRLQGAKLYQGKNGREFLRLDFYPDLDLIWALDNKGLAARAYSHELIQGLKPVQQPALLYLKAHFWAHRLQRLEVSDTGRRICFQFGERGNFEWNLGEKTWTFRVPGKKDYLQHLPRWDKVESLGTSNKGDPSIEGSWAKSKSERLLRNIERDRAQAQEWLETNRAPIEFFFENPQLWGETISLIPIEYHSWIREQSSKLSFTPKNRKLALEKLSELLDRQERKLEMARVRLGKVQEELLSGGVERFQKQKKQRIDGSKTPEGPQRKTARSVSLGEGLIAFVGRNAQENDDLYRRAKSRDLWFHVRGQKGGHVWVPRGQVAFPAKGEVSEDKIKEAALLAAKHSKVRGSWIAVDCAERRFLKKAKGLGPGALLVQKSRTIFVTLED